MTSKFKELLSHNIDVYQGEVLDIVVNDFLHFLVEANYDLQDPKHPAKRYYIMCERNKGVNQIHNEPTKPPEKKSITNSV